jgi:hypothetical protein
MKVISADFANSVIREGFGKVFRVTGGEACENILLSLHSVYDKTG